MRRLLPLILAVALSWAAGDALAQEARIVQQRLPDGSIVLTDRPQSEGRVERSWTIARDPDADAQAAARRQQATREAAEVNARIGRQLEREQERMHELELLRQRAAAADAERAAARARAEAEDALPRQVVIARPPRLHPPRPTRVRDDLRPPPRRPPTMSPRPGPTPPPHKLAAAERPGV